MEKQDAIIQCLSEIEDALDGAQVSVEALVDMTGDEDHARNLGLINKAHLAYYRLKELLNEQQK